MGNYEVQLWETESLEDHVGLMREQAQKSRRDPEFVRLVKKVIAGHPDDLKYSLTGREPVVRAWGREFKLGKPAGSEPYGKSDDCKIVAIWNFVCANIQYKKDPPGYDLFMTARVMLEEGWGDCDDQTILLTSMATIAGLPRTWARVISTNGKNWCHVYAVVAARQGGRVIKVPLDPTVKGAIPGWEFGAAKSVADLEM